MAFLHAVEALEFEIVKLALERARVLKYKYLYGRHAARVLALRTQILSAQRVSRHTKQSRVARRRHGRGQTSVGRSVSAALTAPARSEAAS